MEETKIKTIENISLLNISKLKEACKEYAQREYNSKLNKQELINILKTKIEYINLDDRAIYLFKDLIKKDYTSNRAMNTLNKEWYLYKGFSSEFEERYIDKHKYALKFDNIIFKTKDYNYVIVEINKNKSYSPHFKKNLFQLIGCGKDGDFFKIEYEGDIGFSLDRNKGILFINAIINEYFFDRSVGGWEYLSEMYSHTYDEILNYVNNKENFELVKEYPRCFPNKSEGLIQRKI